MRYLAFYTMTEFIISLSMIVSFGILGDSGDSGSSDTTNPGPN